MTLVATATEANATRKYQTVPSGTGYFRTTYLPAQGEAAKEPMCYLVEQDANSTINAHFHQVNQFQVFVACGGHLGKRAIAPLVVHYVDAHTPYGPIISGSEGVHYFTLRERFDPGAQFLPESINKLPRVKRRHFTAGPIEPGQANERPASGKTEMVEVIAPQADGLGAWQMRLGADAKSASIGDQPAGAQFWLLMDGAALHNGRALSRYAAIYTHAAHGVPEIVSTAEGANLLVLQFPRAE